MSQSSGIRKPAHPTPLTYVRVAAILGAITALEVGIFYVDMAAALIVGIFFVLSATKFALVVLFFMHLKFDARLFSTLFVGGIILAMSVIVSVLAMFGTLLENPVIADEPPKTIEVVPTSASVAVGRTQEFSATGTYSDNFTRDLTATVTWSTSDESVATIDPSGLASGIAEGEVTITAASNGVNGSAALTVTPPVPLIAIRVSSTSASVGVGNTQQLTANGTFTDDFTQDITITATWSSSDASVATIDPSGLVTGVAEGEATITATSSDIQGSATLTVTEMPSPTLTDTPSAPPIGGGATVFISKGCGACHTITGLPGAIGTIGPDQDDIATRAATRVPGLSAEAYIRQSIEDPTAFILPGFAPVMLPLRDSMTAQEFEDLVAYLLTLE